MRRNAGTTPQSLRRQLMNDGFAVSEVGQAVH
jgi:hypothetical protein